MFSTIGVALAVGIAVAFLAAVTLLPAVLVLAGPARLGRRRARDRTADVLAAVGRAHRAQAGGATWSPAW